VKEVYGTRYIPTARVARRFKGQRSPFMTLIGGRASLQGSTKSFHDFDWWEILGPKQLPGNTCKSGTKKQIARWSGEY
jgi:hypothetical protein